MYLGLVNDRRIVGCNAVANLMRVFSVVSLFLTAPYRCLSIYRVFRNLWDPLRELILCLKIMKKSQCKYMPYLSSFMRYNESSVLITFTKDARNWPPCISRQACTRFVIDLVTLSIIPGVSRICRKHFSPCTILFRSISACSIDVAYTIDFKCPHKWKSSGFKSGERAAHAIGPPFICKVLI